MSKEEIDQSTQGESDETLRARSPSQRWFDEAVQMQEVLKCPVSVDVTGDGMTANFIMGVPRVPQEKVIFVKPTNNKSQGKGRKTK